MDETEKNADRMIAEWIVVARKLGREIPLPELLNAEQVRGEPLVK